MRLGIVSIMVLWMAIVDVSYGQEDTLHNHQESLKWFLPILSENRQSLRDVRITHIGTFGLLRKARPGIPAHLHTGVDLKRPKPYHAEEPVFPAAEGVVVSLREDGPFAQIIVQHDLPNSKRLWTVYEHVAGIRIRLNEEVVPNRAIARFMNRDELNRYGWHFNHVHFEVMKVKPPSKKPDKKRPFLRYGTYCLVCYTPKDLDAKYHNPLEFLKRRWRLQ